MRMGDDLGKRLATYRRQRGLSAQKLADQSGGRITRFTIAAIESGRKKAPSMEEIGLLAALLGVPPIALILPLDRPYSRVEVTEDWSPTVAELLHWFVGLDPARYTDGYFAGAQRAAVAPDAIPYWIREYERAMADAMGAVTLGKQGVIWAGPGEAPNQDEAHARIDAARAMLESMGVSLDRES